MADTCGNILQPIQQYNANRTLVSEIKNTVDFVIERFNTIPTEQKLKLKNKITSDLAEAIRNHTSLIRDTEFEVATVRELDTLEKLREVHSDDEIKYLLEERTDVTGIKFNPTDDEFRAQLGSASDVGVWPPVASRESRPRGRPCRSALARRSSRSRL